MTQHSPDIETLLGQSHTVLYQQDVDGRLLCVKETGLYRWFELGGTSIQSLMNKSKPEQAVTPISQALLIFLLFDNKPLKVLNLGLGGASIERALAALTACEVISVESSQPVIDIANQFFELPAGAQVFCEDAQQFVRATTDSYDVVVCDMFIDEKIPGFLSSQSFFSQLAAITFDDAVVIVNTQAENEAELLVILQALRKHFPYIALIEFEAYKNIVVVARSRELPDAEALRRALVAFPRLQFFDLEKSIDMLRYIPPPETQ